jgi:16S rRNA (uracil1498-N3)-methyltransferase
VPRFFVPPEQIQNGRFYITGAEARHAHTVLRKNPGDTIDLFDGKDNAYSGRIETITEEHVNGVLVANLEIPRVGVEIILAQGLLKGPKWDWLIEKASEIGVKKLLPLLTSRTVVQTDPEGAAMKISRWNRIALAAAKQCGRPDVMEVAEPVAFADYVRLKSDAFYLIPWEKESSRRIADVPRPPKTTKVVCFIGPEGGWEESEVAMAERMGATPVRLGPTLLRAETAGIVAATLILREFEVY